MRIKIFILSLIMPTLVMCVAPTGYIPSNSDTDFGYQDRIVGENKYWIDFLGNSFTNTDDVETYWETRAGELCGGDNFDIEDYQSGFVRSTYSFTQGFRPGRTRELSDNDDYPFSSGNVICH